MQVFTVGDMGYTHVYGAYMERLGPERGVVPSNRLIERCRWMGSHFHDWIDYNGVVFSSELLEWGCTFSEKK